MAVQKMNHYIKLLKCVWHFHVCYEILNKMLVFHNTQFELPYALVCLQNLNKHKELWIKRILCHCWLG